MSAEIVQQTEEWFEFRRNKIGASDAPIILEVSPWSTPYKLWEEKLGLRESNFTNHSMQRGLDLEEEARLHFTLETGLVVNPKVLVSKENPWMMASLDGFTDDKKHAVEIKCPGFEDHEKAKSGRIPDKYYPQLQHQLEVSELEMIHYYSYDGREGVVVEVFRDDKYIKNMINKEKKFWDCLQDFTPPKMLEVDYQVKQDDLWLEAACEWLSISQRLNLLEKKEKEIRDTLISMAGKKNSVGGGIRVSKIVRKGPVNYEKIPELIGVNFEEYRKNPVEYWKIAND